MVISKLIGNKKAFYTTFVVSMVFGSFYLINEYSDTLFIGSEYKEEIAKKKSAIREIKKTKILTVEEVRGALTREGRTLPASLMFGGDVGSDGVGQGSIVGQVLPVIILSKNTQDKYPIKFTDVSFDKKVLKINFQYYGKINDGE